LVFLFLNVLIHSFFKKNFNGQDFGLNLLIDHLYDVLIFGIPNLTAFEILLPIAYLLLLCAICYSLKQYKYIIFIIIISVFVLLSYYQIILPYNLKCILIGTGGFYTGLISLDYKNISDNIIYKMCAISLLILYLLYIAPNPIKLNILSYYIIINIIIANLHLAGKRLSNSNFLIKIITKFGQYSLLLYISQILYLQIFTKIIDFKSDVYNYYHSIIIAAIILLLIVTYSVLEKMRRINQFIDKCYRIVFG